jgi:TrmH family RNA methyltransferase
VVTSRQNPLLKTYRELHDARGRRDHGLWLLEGVHLVDEALRHGLSLHSVLWSRRLPPGLLERVPSGVRLEEVDDDLLDYVSTTKTAQAVAAAVKMPADRRPDPGRAWLVLDAVSDPGNLGNLVRTGAAAGIGGVVLWGACADPGNPKALRSSAGTLLWVPVVPGSEEVLAGRDLVAATSHPGACYDDPGLDGLWRGPVALVIGSEAHGVSAEVVARLKNAVHIPMAPGVESLNAAAAGAVLLFHVGRLRRS